MSRSNPCWPELRHALAWSRCLWSQPKPRREWRFAWRNERPMPDDGAAARLQRARSVSGDDLDLLIHEADAETLLALLENPNMQEPHVSRLLERLDLSAGVLTAVAKEGKWTSSESIRLRLARHPRTPSRIAISMLRQLYLFDLVRLSLLPAAPVDIRRAAEEFILTRVPHIPIGEKLTLA